MRVWLVFALSLFISLSSAHGQMRSPNQTKDQVSSSMETPSTTGQLSEADEALLKSMPLKKKVGQLLMIGFMGQTLTQGLSETIKAIHPGGIVVFGRNITSARQISDLNIAAQTLSLRETKLPLLIGVDQEGGDVIRIKTAFPLPSALAIGEAGQPQLAESAGRATGGLLKTLGFTMNLAPVLDIGDPNVASFIGTRTYGSNPGIVSRMGFRFGRGLEHAGVLPTAKHFPGHGGVNEDSHRVAPEKDLTLDQLLKSDAVPFQYIAKEAPRPWAYMLAHVSYPNLDPTRMPATFSKPIIQGLLRDRFGFSGIVLTDDIEMAGAHVIRDTGERAIRAIEAGADMVMMAWNRRMQRKVADALYIAAKSGRISEERINESITRIMIAKRAYANATVKRPTNSELKVALQNREFQRIAEETMISLLERPANEQERSFTEYASDKSIFAFSMTESFSRTFRMGVPQKQMRFFPLSRTSPAQIDRILRANPNGIGVFHVSSPTVARIANRLSDDVARRMLIVTVEPQGLLKKPERFRYIAEIYYRHPQLGKLIAQHFFAPGTTLRTPSGTSTQSRSQTIPSQFVEASDKSSISPTTGALNRAD